MNEELRKMILDLLHDVENVVHNNDWPTEDGHLHDDGVTCTCPLLDRVNFIREKIQ
jgi:hypothetical protein